MSCWTGRRRSGPLAVDPLATLVKEHRGVAGARVELGEVVRHRDQIGVVPGTGADAVARVGRLVAVRRVAFDAEVGAPRAAAGANRGGQPLTGRVGARQTAEIAGHARRAGDEEAQRRTRRRRRRLAAARGNEEDRDQQPTVLHHPPLSMSCGCRVERRIAASPVMHAHFRLRQPERDMTAPIVPALIEGKRSRFAVEIATARCDRERVAAGFT